MMGKLSALEQEAYTLAGHPFSLTSTDDIAQVCAGRCSLPSCLSVCPSLSVRLSLHLTLDWFRTKEVFSVVTLT